MNELLPALGYGAAYCLLGTAMLVAAWYVFDLLTPGRLGERLHESHSAALVAGTWMVAQGAIVFTAIWTNADAGFGAELAWTAAFGVLGIVLQAAAFRLVDVVTPGRLGDELMQPGPMTPLARLFAGVIAAVALVVVASIA